MTLLEALIQTVLSKPLTVSESISPSMMITRLCAIVGVPCARRDLDHLIGESSFAVTLTWSEAGMTW